MWPARAVPAGRKSLLFCLVLITTQAISVADPANGDPRLEKLFKMFIAPCCWRGNLLVHSSPDAENLRTEVRSEVAKGSADDEIKRKFLAKYSTRVLAFPDGVSGQWLLWTPWILAATGMTLISIVIKRSAERPKTNADAASIVLPSDSEWEDR